jgi:hypothetical protein
VGRFLQALYFSLDEVLGAIKASSGNLSGGKQSNRFERFKIWSFRVGQIATERHKKLKNSQKNPTLAFVPFCGEQETFEKQSWQSRGLPTEKSRPKVYFWRLS